MIEDEHPMMWRGPKIAWRVQYTVAMVAGVVMLALFVLGVWKAVELVGDCAG